MVFIIGCKFLVSIFFKPAHTTVGWLRATFAFVHNMVPGEGIEPPQPDSKSDVLPLNEPGQSLRFIIPRILCVAPQ
jgi:hypothetical protein